MRTSIVECNLAALCMGYLAFDCFDQDIDQERLLAFATQGYFAFQDYAIANWSHHFSAMVERGQDLLASGSDKDDAVQEAIQQLENALNDFVSFYEEDLPQEAMAGSSEGRCEAFKQCNFYHGLQSVQMHVFRHQEKGSDAKNDLSLKILGEALARNRRLLEDLTSAADPFYGDRRWKCPKVTCFHFHEGFKDAKSRGLHRDRHDRPFRCNVPDCSGTDFGFGSSKDLDKHMRSFHPELDEQRVTFAAAKTGPARTPWACSECDKRFTRGFHLRSHIRSHRGERPFTCRQCDKAFTRANDCKRHEQIHAR